jgi:hypothetical protein
MERRITIKEILPEGAYLASKYFDPFNHLVTRRIYYEKGNVEAFDGKEWWTVCFFNPLQVKHAKEYIVNSGLKDASDLRSEEVHDAAMLAYAWRINNLEGVVTNWAYPAVDHPAMEALEQALDNLASV